ncbi:MAG: 2OG-Fe(II) oxygenase family protein [Pseudomonadota bacterium]
MPELRVINLAAPDFDGAVAEAFSEHGGFVAAGCGSLIAEIGALLEFFDQPAAEKRKLATRRHEPTHLNIYRGYNPPPVEANWSYNETFDLGPEPPLSAPDLPSRAAFTEATVWPDPATLPEWRAAAERFQEGCVALARSIAAAAARGLSGDETATEALMGGRNSTLRLLNYPPPPQDFTLLTADGAAEAPKVDGKMTVAREHTDTGLMSILWQDSEGGLQMLGRDGVWRDTPIGEGLSVHCGDLLSPVLSPAMAATPHRVLGGKAARQSAGVFIEPDYTAEVMTPDGGLKTYAAHLTDRFPGRFEAQ